MRLSRREHLLAVGGALSLAGCSTIPGQSGGLTVDAEFVDEPFPGGFDPLVFHRSQFADDRYRILVLYPNEDEHTLWSTREFETFTEEATGLYPTVAAERGSTFNHGTVLLDGRFAVYTADADTDTSVWVGDSLTDLEELGTVLRGHSDPGVYLDRDGTVHIYTEGDGDKTGPTSNTLKHFTTPADDLLRPEEQSIALDLSDRDWSTGDPEIFRIGETYYMLHDRTQGHPSYYIALSKSSDLFEWTVVDDKLTDLKGGDMEVARRDGIFHGFTEYSGDDEWGVGHWTLTTTRS